MADWNKPALNNLYVDFLTYMKALTADLAKGCDPAKTTITNPFADMTRFNSATGRWEIYNGTTWGVLASSYDINVTNLGGKAANLYALLASPNFSGTPQCPTADVTANNQLLANTSFVQLIKAGMIDGAPANLNTLNKLAASLGNDPAFATTYNTAWSTHLNAADPHGQYAFDSDLTTHAAVAASTTVVGHTRLATTAETTTGTASNIATHPAGVAAAIAAAMAALPPTISTSGIAVFEGSGIFTVPDGVTNVYVTGFGGGGGGCGGTYSGISAYSGGGGGGGACTHRYRLNVTAGQSYTITIGAGGTGGASKVLNGATPGGSTSFGGLLSITGGGAGGSVNGGAGGAGSGFIFRGFNGNNGMYAATLAAALPGGNGGAALVYSGGGGGAPVGMSSSTGFGYGSGGGGGASGQYTTGVYTAGSNGLPGIMIIEW